MTLLTAQHIVVIQHKDKVIFLDTNNCLKSCLGRIYPKLSRLDNWIKLLLRLPSFGEQRGGMGPFVGVVSFNRAVRAHTIERQKNKDSWLCVKKGTGLLLKTGQYFAGPKAQINSVILYFQKDFPWMFNGKWKIWAWSFTTLENDQISIYVFYIFQLLDFSSEKDKRQRWGFSIPIVE
jgi:hypothetical protein